VPVHLQEFLETLANLVWGPPMLTLTVGTGLFLTVRLRGLQFRRLWSSLYRPWGPAGRAEPGATAPPSKPR